VASLCEPMMEMRGSSPTAVCVALWGTREPTLQETAVAMRESKESTAAAAADGVSLLDESFAAPLALAAALALYA
jgi:hypothetical protein